MGQSRPVMMDRLPPFPSDGLRRESGDPRRPARMSCALRRGSGLEVAGFRIESVLGRGGMSVVYVAEQIRLAPKGRAQGADERSWPGTSSSASASCASRTSRPRSTTRTSSPSTTPGEADGLLYIAMRFVQGPDLKEILKRGSARRRPDDLPSSSSSPSALDAAHARVARPSRREAGQHPRRGEHRPRLPRRDFGVAKHTTRARPDLDRALSSAPSSTRRPSRSRADRSARVPTSMPSAASCTSP